MGATGPLGILAPSNSQLVKYKTSVIHVKNNDNQHKAIYANDIPSFNRDHGCLWGYRQNLWMIDDQLFLSSNDESSDTKRGEIYDIAHIQLINGTRQIRGVTGSYLHICQMML